MKLFFTFLLFVLCQLIYCHSTPESTKNSNGFTENKGQWDIDILFSKDIPNGKMLLAKNKIAYVLSENRFEGHAVRSQYRRHDLIIDFLGASTRSTVGAEPQEGVKNYFYGNNPSNWVSGVKTFNKIGYNSLYSGIDLEVLNHHGDVKYQFIVQAGADPSMIQMNYQGAVKMEITNSGKLAVMTSVNQIIENKPFAYQVINGEVSEVDCVFLLDEGVVTFNLGIYDSSYELVIDPELVFSSFSGSSEENWGNTACHDIYNNVISGGVVLSDFSVQEFPITVGAYQSSQNGGDTDILLYKLDSLGSSLIFATYIGGSGTEIPLSVNVDPLSNEIVLLVTTGSSDFPTTSSAFQSIFKGGSPIRKPTTCDFLELGTTGFDFESGTDVVILKLNESGQSLTGSTYFGGTGNEGVLYQNKPLTKNYGDHFRGDIHVDQNRLIYIASNTHSSDLFSTSEFSGVFGGGDTDAMFAVFNQDLSSVIGSGYLGGSGSDASYSVKTDNSGFFYLGGGTSSQNFPIFSSAYRSSYGGEIDGFVAKLKLGQGLVQSTFLGTNKYDQVYFIDVDENENVYAYGQTKGQYPVSSGVYSNSNAGQFLHKINSSLSTSFWSTTIGSSASSTSSIRPNISPSAFAVNECGFIMLSGWGGSVNSTSQPVFGGCPNVPTGFVGGNTFGMPLTNSAYKPITDGADFYLATLSVDSRELLYATYFGGGGDHVDGGTSRFDKKGNMVQAVCANCDGRGFPVSSISSGSDYPAGPVINGCNNAVFRFSLSEMNLSFSASKCTGLSPSFTSTSYGADTYQWDFGDGSPIVISQEKNLEHTYPSPGIYSVKLIGFNSLGCIKVDSLVKDIAVSEVKKPKSSVDTVCVGDTIQLQSSEYSGDVSYQWFPITQLSDPFVSAPDFYSAETVDYTIRIVDNLGCERVDSINMFVPKPQLKIGVMVEGNCDGDVPKVVFNDNSQDVISYYWRFDENEVLGPLTFYQFDDYGEHMIKLIGGINSCLDTLETSVVLEELFVQNIVTPNGDGINETFSPLGIENSGNWSLDVFNRWGKQIYSNENYLNQWDGINQEDGVYYYLLTAPDETFCKGWVQLIR